MHGPQDPKEFFSEKILRGKDTRKSRNSWGLSLLKLQGLRDQIVGYLLEAEVEARGQNRLEKSQFSEKRMSVYLPVLHRARVGKIIHHIRLVIVENRVVLYNTEVG